MRQFGSVMVRECDDLGVWRFRSRIENCGFAL